MKINLKVRFKNPVFLAELAAAVVFPILTYLGLNWNDITSWSLLGNIMLSAVQNPVVVVAVVVSVWNAFTDPTTKGLSDSQRAMTYDKPKE